MPLAAALALVAGCQLSGAVTGPRPAATPGASADAAAGAAALPADSADASTPVPTQAPIVAPAAGPVHGPDVNANPDLIRVRADVAFWSARLQAQPRDIVSAQRLAESDVDEARITGDVTAYLRADDAIGRALAVVPSYAPALDTRAAIDVALHRFTDARDLATRLLDANPADPSALGTLADASLELGDVATARQAVTALVRDFDSAAAQVRRSHLAFIEGDTATAVAAARQALAEADDEDLPAERAAWYAFQLGETLAATGDLAGAESAYERALAADPYSYLARSGLARVAAARQDWSTAIRRISEAIDIIPLPDFLARRGDLYELRASPGDAGRSAADRATIEAIARLAGSASNVYDRTLSLYLASHGLEPARALALAENELAVRKDVYGYDADAWALLAAGRPADARGTMATALAFGTRDAKLLYHAGMIAAASGDPATARSDLIAALALDPSFDPFAVRRARQTLAALP